MPAIWYDASLPPPPPEGDGPKEGWRVLIFMFAFVAWSVVWLAAALVCAVVEQRRAARARAAPQAIW